MMVFKRESLAHLDKMTIPRFGDLNFETASEKLIYPLFAYR